MERQEEKDKTPEAALLRLFMQKLMGKSLDFGRMSGMSDRSFEQFKKNLKDDYYHLLKQFNQLLDELLEDRSKDPQNLLDKSEDSK